MIFLSVNLKIKQNCLTRRVYSDRKPGCLTFSVCSFPISSALALGTTLPHIFKATPHGPQAHRFEFPLSALAGPGRWGRIGGAEKGLHPKLGRKPELEKAPIVFQVDRLLEVVFSLWFCFFPFSFLFLSPLLSFFLFPPPVSSFGVY